MTILENSGNRTTIGWREWGYLPDLDIGPIKIKIDTGARTSALHAYDIEIVNDVIHFKVHTIQGRDDFFIQASAPFVGERIVTDSGGKATTRPAIRTRLSVGGFEQLVDLTLIDRQQMSFRMLMGRGALAGNYMVDCNAEYLGGIPVSTHSWKIQ